MTVNSVIELLANNRRVLQYQENNVEILNSKLNKLRLGKSGIVSSPVRSKKDEELPVTPNFMKKPIRADTANKLKKMFLQRSSVPVVPSPKKQQAARTINKRPDFLLQAQLEAQNEAQDQTETTQKVQR